MLSIAGADINLNIIIPEIITELIIKVLFLIFLFFIKYFINKIITTIIKRQNIKLKPPALQASGTGATDTNTTAKPPSAV